MNPDFTFVKVKDRILKQIKSVYSYRFPLYEFDFISDAGFLLETCEEIVAKVTRSVYAEDLGDKTVTAVATLYVPDTWWDHFKLESPDWFRSICSEINFRKESVTVSKKFNVKMSFPDYVPPQGMQPYVIIREVIL